MADLATTVLTSWSAQAASSKGISLTEGRINSNQAMAIADLYANAATTAVYLAESLAINMREEAHSQEAWQLVSTPEILHLLPVYVACAAQTLHDQYRGKSQVGS